VVIALSGDQPNLSRTMIPLGFTGQIKDIEDHSSIELVTPNAVSRSVFLISPPFGIKSLVLDHLSPAVVVVLLGTPAYPVKIIGECVT